MRGFKGYRNATLRDRTSPFVRGKQVGAESRLPLPPNHVSKYPLSSVYLAIRLERLPRCFDLLNRSYLLTEQPAAHRILALGIRMYARYRIAV